MYVTLLLLIKLYIYSRFNKKEVQIYRTIKIIQEFTKARMNKSISKNTRNREIKI